MCGGEAVHHLNQIVRCPGRDLNPHDSFEPGGFKPPVSANSTTRASAEG